MAFFRSFSWIHHVLLALHCTTREFKLVITRCSTDTIKHSQDLIFFILTEIDIQRVKLTSKHEHDYNNEFLILQNIFKEVLHNFLFHISSNIYMKATFLLAAIFVLFKWATRGEGVRQVVCSDIWICLNHTYLHAKYQNVIAKHTIDKI